MLQQIMHPFYRATNDSIHYFDCNELSPVLKSAALRKSKKRNERAWRTHFKQPLIFQNINGS
jgi:hypothetical protein